MIKYITFVQVVFSTCKIITTLITHIKHTLIRCYDLSFGFALIRLLLYHGQKNQASGGIAQIYGWTIGL